MKTTLVRTLFSGIALSALFTVSLASAQDAAKEPTPLPLHSPEVQSVMKDYFGNTRICREDALFECHMWVKPDGTYVLFGFNRSTVDPRNGLHAAIGTWFLAGTKGAYKLCRKAEGAAKAGCEPEAGLKVGDVFTKYHANGTYVGSYEHYILAHGQI